MVPFAVMVMEAYGEEEERDKGREVFGYVKTGVKRERDIHTKTHPRGTHPPIASR